MSLKLKYLLRALLLLLIPVSASGAETYAPLPPALDGSMMPYDFDACTQIPTLPDTLKPVYASYVARHGARYLSSPNKLKPVMDALIQGRNTGTLSATGEAFLKLMERVEAANKDNWGDLTPIGIQEERRLGKRMFQMLTPLSEEQAPVFGIASYVPRCVMTMYQFSNQLIRLNDRMTVSTDEGTRFNPLLCCFIADETYAEFRKKGSWKKVYKDFVSRTVPTGPASRLFTGTRLTDHELRELTLDMYEVLKANRAASLPAPTTRWMSVQEYRACWRASNLSHYLRNSISPLSDAAGKATAPLLKQMIRDTETALSFPQGAPVLNGYFGHAETLLPLLSLLKIPGCNFLKLDYETLDNYWKIQELTPLGANLVVLISRGPSGRHYAVIQLNGRTIQPIRGEGDIVAWDHLRDYWLSLMGE